MAYEILFETERCIVTYLQMSDLEPFHEMHNNINVMKYVRGKEMTREENEKELPELIEKYIKADNDFWIFAIRRKEDKEFLGTCALVKDDHNDDEIGYRFLEKYWKNGYGLEICLGLIDYCKSLKMKHLIGYVADDNIASAKILEKSGFKTISKGFDSKLKLSETKYKLDL